MWDIVRPIYGVHTTFLKGLYNRTFCFSYKFLLTFHSISAHQIVAPLFTLITITTDNVLLNPLIAYLPYRRARPIRPFSAHLSYSRFNWYAPFFSYMQLTKV